ncbi:MAG: zf-HC2 domain-containing protein [Woeseiaceae bacterium]|nr:zf-HC2 domain-containing protein [Woeseiaceae bacterium]
MAVDSKIVELINADIDGEISPADKQELEAALAADPEAQAMHAELSGLSRALHELPDLDPPPHLKHAIMASVPGPQKEPAREGWLQSLFAAPALRYAGMFAAGALLTLSLVSSDQLSDRAFTDVTGLVGTISSEVPEGPDVQTARIDRPEVAGRVSLRSSGPLLIVDFDLVSSGPVDIEASYSDQTVWFNGFAQLESTGASVSAEAGRFTMQIDGKRRSAVFLHNAGDRDVAINLQFKSGDAVVYDTEFSYAQDASGR